MSKREVKKTHTQTTDNFISEYFREVCMIIERLDFSSLRRVLDILVDTRASSGRLFIAGIGGSAANASHAVNDFRVISNIEAYAITDNVAELTARMNDNGWSATFKLWLKSSRMNSKDTLFVFSVSGGNQSYDMSLSLVEAIKYAKHIGSRVIGIVGDPDCYTRQMADACIIIPILNREHVSAHSEAFQALIWHMLISHPALKIADMRWESHMGHGSN